MFHILCGNYTETPFHNSICSNNVLGGITHNPYHPQQRIMRLGSSSQVEYTTAVAASYPASPHSGGGMDENCFE